MTFGSYDDADARNHRPRAIFVDDENRPVTPVLDR